MARNTITFELGGRVPIETFRDGISYLQQLVAALTRGNNVTWIIEDLQVGSAITTLRGEAEDLEIVDQIVGEFAQIGSALASDEPLPRKSVHVTQAANAIQALANSVDYVRLETSEDDFVVYGNGTETEAQVQWTTVGAISGRVQALSKRGGLRFNLYEAVHDRAISCYLQQGQEELMREAWDRRVTVGGTIYRQGPLGRPVAIRNILSVDILEEAAQGAYLRARGAVPWQEGDEMPEDVIRELRDA